MALNTSVINCKNEQIKIALYPTRQSSNIHVERFNRTVRYDWLNQDIFESIEEIQEKAIHWLWHYNNRPLKIAAIEYWKGLPT